MLPFWEAPVYGYVLHRPVYAQSYVLLDHPSAILMYRLSFGELRYISVWYLSLLIWIAIIQCSVRCRTQRSIRFYWFSTRPISVSDWTQTQVHRETQYNYRINFPTGSCLRIAIGIIMAFQTIDSARAENGPSSSPPFEMYQCMFYGVHLLFCWSLLRRSLKYRLSRLKKRLPGRQIYDAATILQYSQHSVSSYAAIFNLTSTSSCKNVRTNFIPCILCCSLSLRSNFPVWSRLKISLPNLSSYQEST